MRLILASASPRRRELLAGAGVAFEWHPMDVDERRLTAEPPEAYALRVAQLKATEGATRWPDALVLAADTVVVIGDEILGKPADDAEAAEMLAKLSGRAHVVLTAVALAGAGATRTWVERTTVRFRPLGAEEIAAYIASGEPMDKAGAYGIQGLAAKFVAATEGSYSNVVGLPVAPVLHMLRNVGYLPLDTIS